MAEWEFHTKSKAPRENFLRFWVFGALDKDSRVSASFFQVANNCASGETRGGAGGGLEPGSRATHLPICPRMCDAQDYSMGLAAAMMKGAWDLQADGGSAPNRPRTSVCTCGVWRDQPMNIGCLIGALIS